MSAFDPGRYEYPVVCVVDFHHGKGPVIEDWIGLGETIDPGEDHDWKDILPFLALPDGAHAATQDLSYFTLRRRHTPSHSPSSLFGIACTRQIDSNILINRPADVTRSTKQKAVVVICESPQTFGQLKEKLSVVTKAWFAQRDFTDLKILEDFRESILRERDEEGDGFFGLNLRELLREYKSQVLVLFKCLLLQPKMLFFATHCERLCMIQFSLISLIPGLIRHLGDCADPAYNSYEQNMVRPTSLKTSERASLLAYVGLPLQVFGKGALFGPYTPLQQLDVLDDENTKSYVVGFTNSLLLNQKERYSDIFIHLDEGTITISSAPLRQALALTIPDRRWIDFLTQTVNDTWDDSNPSRPKNLGYAGSEEFIRLQFEEYILALLSAVKYRLYVEQHRDDPKALLSEVDGDPANEFGSEWVKAWMQTDNFRLFNSFTDSHIFDIVEPHHPCTGGLSIEDIQRRLATQVAELHLDERLNSGREVIGKHLATGQARVSEAFNNLWADIEKKREEQRARAAERKAVAAAAEADGSPESPTDHTASSNGSRYSKAPDLSQAQATVQAAGQKAGQWFGGWRDWAADKQKGWRAAPPPTPESSLKSLSLVDKTREERQTDSSGAHAQLSAQNRRLSRQSMDRKASLPVNSLASAQTAAAGRTVEKSGDR